MIKKIVLVPDAYYLSDPIYTRLLKSKVDYSQYIYLNTNFPMSFVQSVIPNTYKLFDSYIEISGYDTEIIRSVIFNKNPLFRFANLKKFIHEYYLFRSKIYEVLDQLRPSAIIVTADKLLASKEFYFYAKKHQIPYIVYQSAFLEAPDIKMPKRLKNLLYAVIFNSLLRIPLANSRREYGNEFKDNYLLLWGNHFAAKYIGKKENKFIKTIGNPQYDEIYSKGNKIIDQRKETFPAEKLKVLICTQELAGLVSKKAQDELKNIYRELIINNPTYQFCIKVHPRESEEDYISLFDNESTTNLVITKNTDLNKLYNDYHIQISTTSLTSFNALISGLPIILVKPDLMPFFNHFFNDIALKANDSMDILHHLRIINSYDYYNKFIDRRESFLRDILCPDSINRFKSFLNDIL